jgi:hypothetical protein
MSRLPVSLAEADALTHARRLVAAVRDGKLALGGIEHGHWFDKDEVDVRMKVSVQAATNSSVGRRRTPPT